MRRALILFALVSGPALAAQCPVDSDVEMADMIARGHAFEKHVLEDHEYQRPIDGHVYQGPPITSSTDFAHLLESIVAPGHARRILPHDREAYWDSPSGTVVILNPHSKDCGTAFRPDRGQSYFDHLH